MIKRLFSFVTSRLTQNREKQIIGKFVRSIPEKSWDESLMKNVVTFRKRTEAVIEMYNLPASKDAWIRKSKAFDDEYMYELSDVTVSSSTGVCWLPDGRIIGESFGSLSRLLSNRNFQGDYFDDPRTLDGEVISMPLVGGFFHFMFEVLPSVIAALEMQPDYKLLIPEKCPEYVKDYGNLIAAGRILSATGPVRVKRIVVAGKTPYSGFVQKAEIVRLQRFFATLFPVAGAEDRIYISRRMDNRRVLENELQLEQRLSAFGFKSYFLQELPVRAQVELFRRAKIVIAPHGAGLSNLVWCNRGIKVIEIFAFKSKNDCYSRLSWNLGLDYKYFICSKSESSAGLIPIEEIIKEAVAE